MGTSLKLDPKTLADVIYSSAMTLGINDKSNKSPNNSDVLPKTISFNLNSEDNLMVIGDNRLFDIKNDNFIRSSSEILDAVQVRLEEVLEGKDIEFISQDPITKSVVVFTEDYVDKLVNKEIPIGELILNYFRQWYSSKCGAGQKATRDYHEKFKTFSQREIDYLKHRYIPIMVTTKELKPIYNSIKPLMESSPIKDFLVTDVGYNINGGRVEGSKTYWLPRIVAKEYLEESDDFKVLSIRVLNKLITDAGLLGGEPVKEHKEISKEMFSDIGVKAMADNFILSKNGLDAEVEERKRIKELISIDIDTSDNFIPDNVGRIEIDY